MIDSKSYDYYVNYTNDPCSLNYTIDFVYILCTFLLQIPIPIKKNHHFMISLIRTKGILDENICTIIYSTISRMIFM